MIGLGEREMVIECMDQACAAGARQAEACKVLGLSARIVQRWREVGLVKAHARQMAARVPANKLSEQERQQVLQVVNQGEFQSLPPSQIVPALADWGLYIACESTFYRVLREEGQLKHRGKAKAPTHRVPQATRPALRIRCGAGISPTWLLPSKVYSSICTWISIAARSSTKRSRLDTSSAGPVRFATGIYPTLFG